MMEKDLDGALDVCFKGGVPGSWVLHSKRNTCVAYLRTSFFRPSPLALTRA
jgi:hypothetical protein